MKRQGDIYLYHTGNGGEVSIVNGEPIIDQGLETAAYLSMFGSEGDHWINEYAEENEKLDSQFYSYIKGNPKTAQSMKKAIDLIRQDFKWMLNVGLADFIETEITSVSLVHILVTIKILKDNELVNESIFKMNWRAQRLSPASGRL